MPCPPGSFEVWALCATTSASPQTPSSTLSGLPDGQADSLLAKSGIPSDRPYVCVSVRDWNSTEAFKTKIAALCDELTETWGRTVILVAMQTPNDIAVSNKVARLMKKKAYVLDTRFSAEQIMGIIGGADFILSMRLHTLIFSARMCVPLIGMIYDPKVTAYIEALGMPSAGDVRNFRPGYCQSRRPGCHGQPGKICRAAEGAFP